MKKILALLLCGLLLQGCGSKETAAVKDPEPTRTETPAPTKTETPAPSATEEPEQEEISVSLPEQELTADYTTAEGIALPPGSHIAVVVKETGSGFWKAVKAGMELAVADLNEELGYKGKDKVKLTFEGPADASEIEAQINIIDAVLAENPAALCLSAIDRGSCQAQLETAAENGIPVILMDGNARGNESNMICSTDHYAVGQEAASHLAAALQDTGKAAIVAHQPQTESCEERERGFRTEIAENHPGITVLPESVYDDGEESVSAKVKTLLAENPDLTGIFCTNEETAEVVLAELKKDSSRTVSVVTVDAGSEITKAIRDGRDIGSVCQNPYGIGYASVIAAARWAADLPVDTYINPGYQWIDASNLDAPENQKYLYE